MIEVRECSKAFGQTKAVNQATLDIGDREVFGLVGSNGAGKSTLLRMMAGIIRPDQGEILIDDLPVYENEEAKKLFFYISDDSYFPPNYTAVDMVRFYRNFYPEFRIKLFHELMDQFHLEKKQRISSFSKGMKKQLLVIIGVCAGTKYLLCDETFDGLDPVMRQAVKSLFASEIMNREFTPVIASHNLRELEDICDHVGLLAQGRNPSFQRPGGYEIPYPQDPVRSWRQAAGEGTGKRTSGAEGTASGLPSYDHGKGNQIRNRGESPGEKSSFHGGASSDSGGNFYQRNGGGWL